MVLPGERGQPRMGQAVVVGGGVRSGPRVARPCSPPLLGREGPPAASQKAHGVSGHRDPARPTAARQPARQGCLARGHANGPAHLPTAGPTHPATETVAVPSAP